ncbi:hypothetical protein [Phaeobacter gallaeciensis]|uniref:Outer membrane autotransporter n=1 Tax=Phaeobacter gallaeciensis TaxID=60890 RepID=A0AAC9Z8R8_9RHOB|nr:hypothetical protein [Phaeobacter gallaeciensis]AHD10063.1 hypothetical protein Gal_02317 [Phaeobacter gallaeciensis DSM 26640]ATE93327.1 outer membrane autotransporter [Phaeobacter gallaeciensis]ATE96852.1 outer membrane autotransporter [Phaeobacter gallaeciensis]ATF01991.1 outer membrane autotransporter [Phaeobacter gallaeciensis]ATF06371.1 outer membrane autotransporter [Phaeobacter gallaeciensis]
MQKTMITATTVFALFMSAGASMAGPLNGHGFSGKAHAVRSSVSQAIGNADQMAHTYRTDIGFGQDQNNLTSTQSTSSSAKITFPVNRPQEGKKLSDWVTGDHQKILKTLPQITSHHR